MKPNRQTCSLWLSILALTAACSADVADKASTSNDFTLSVMPDRTAAYGQTINLEASADSDSVDYWHWEYLGTADVPMYSTDSSQAWFVAPSGEEIDLEFKVSACILNSCRDQQVTVAVRDVPIVSISSASDQLTEPDGTLEISMELNYRHDSDITLTMQYSGAAVNGEHFSAPASVTIAADSLRDSFTIAVIDNILDSADIQASVSVAASEQASWTDTDLNFTVIDEDSSPVLSSSPLHTAYSDSQDTGYVATGYDADGNDLSFAISGGADANIFSIDSLSGVLSFKSTPVVEPAQDANGDNIYQLTLSVSDSANFGYGEVNIELIRAINTSSAAVAASAAEADNSSSNSQHLQLTALDRQSVAVSWPIDATADWYALYRRQCPAEQCSGSQWQLRAQNLLSYHVDSISAGQLYQYQVQSYSGAEGRSWGINTDYLAPEQVLNDSGALESISSRHCPTHDSSQDCALGRDHIQAQGLLARQGSGFKGFDLSLSAGCIIDNVTGLHWQRHGASVNQLQLGADWQSYIDAANSSAICGHSDWRIPSANELLSLVDFGSGSMQEIWFADAAAAPYWSYERDAQGAVYTVGASGITRSAAEDYHSLRLVRSDHRASGDVMQLDDGSILDLGSGLTWQPCAYGQSYIRDSGCVGEPKSLSWQQTAQAVASLNQSQRHNWRLPNAKELLSLLAPASNSIDANILPQAPRANYWSSTPSGDGALVWQQSTTSKVLTAQALEQQNALLLVR